MENLKLSKQKNSRDIGGMIGYQGKKVKNNRLFRGGLISKLSKEDIAIIEELHLTDIIDLRSESEFIHRPDQYFENVRYHNFSPIKEDVNLKDSASADSNLLWFLGDSTDGYAHMVKTYKEMVKEDYAIEAFRNFFKVVQIDNRSIYFHCSQGKDRTGLAAYFLEIALGVSEEDAREDYLFTNVAMQEKKKQLKDQLRNKAYFTPGYEKALEEVFSAREEYLDSALNYIKEKYGSVEKFLTDVLDVDFDLLRSIYLI